MEYQDFIKGEVIHYHGEKGISECRIIDIQTKNEHSVYELKDLDTGRISKTVECGRFRLCEKSEPTKKIKIEVSLSWFQTLQNDIIDIELPRMCSEQKKQEIISIEFREWVFNEISAGWSEI